ncbi:MAG: CDP-glycerol glycerophosphotransferase family protein [Candidatus Nitrosotenuis sp.]
MFVLELYEKKDEKKNTNGLLELDLTDLELFSDYEENIEFSEIASKIVGNKKIMEWFSINNISLWWFIHPIIYPKFNDITLFINRLIKVLEQNHVTDLKLHGNFDKISVIKQICQLKNTRLEFSRTKYVLYLMKNRLKNRFKNIAYKKITRRKLERRLHLFSAEKKFVPPENYVIVTSPSSYRRPMANYKTGKTEKQEFTIQPILDLLKQNKIPLLCFDIDYTFRGETSSLKDRLDTEFNWVPIDVFLKNNKSTSVKEELRSLKNSYAELNKLNIHEAFIHKKIALWEYLKPIFDQIFLEPYIPTFLQLMCELEKFMKLTAPKVIIQAYETGPYAKCFEVVAKKLGIKTIGIQHGFLYEGNPDYSHKEIWNEKQPLGNPLPDLMLVFGEYYKKILVEKSHYPQSNIAIMGNPSFYNINELKKVMNRESLLAKYGFEDKKIILIPLSFRLTYYSKNNPDDILLDNLFKGLRDHTDLTILLRPHPGDYEDIEKRLTTKYDSANFRISKGSLIEDLLISDAVVTTVSTVGLDAAVFEKPVIFVNVAGMATSSLGGFQKEMIENDMAISVSPEELISTILSLKKGELWETEKSAKRKQFMHSHFNFDSSVDVMKLIYSN